MADATCSVGSCERPIKVVSRGMCSMHHTRFLRTGQAGESASRRTPSAGLPCRTEGCGNQAAKRGKCRKHYRLELLSERPQCTVEGCGKPWEIAGLCGMHHWRTSQGDVGDAAYRRQSYRGQRCVVEACIHRAATQWMCKQHYQYLLRTGRQPSIFIDCLTCGATIDLRESGNPGTLLHQRRRLCRECLRLRPRGRWCMTTAELADRDGSVCSLCSECVDVTVAWPDPLSPSVDHIVPRSLGGLDEPHNVALAHLRCNISKGIRATA